MIPTGLRRRGRCSRILSAAVLCSIASVAYCGTVVLQTPAQDRSLFDNLLNPFSGWGGGGGGGGSGGSGSGRPYNMPDVAGFGMYPLWKFHKFDGLSLRPVPYGVDIGTGLPPVPPSPSYPAGFPGNGLAAPPPGLLIPVPVPVPAAAGPPPVYKDYGPPPMPAMPPYEPAPLGPEGSYSNPPSQSYAPQGYPPQNYQGPPPPNYQGLPPPNYQGQPPPNYQGPPQQNYQASVPTISYTPQQYGGVTSSPPSNNYGSPSNNYAPAVNVAYMPAQGYNEGYNNAPPAPGYGGPPPSYGGPPPPNYGGPPPPSYGGGYDGMQYGASQPDIQFSSAPQDFEMQQQPQPNFLSAGTFQIPNFAALENPMSVAYPPAGESQQQQAEQGGFGIGGFLKRRSSNPKAESDLLLKTQGAESDHDSLKDVSFDSA